MEDQLFTKLPCGAHMKSSSRLSARCLLPRVVLFALALRQVLFQRKPRGGDQCQLPCAPPTRSTARPTNKAAPSRRDLPSRTSSDATVRCQLSASRDNFGSVWEQTSASRSNQRRRHTLSNLSWLVLCCSHPAISCSVDLHARSLPA